MIAAPTTEQILNECSRELMEVILPAVDDQTVQVAIFMMDLVLRNAAVRAAHEIAWMTDEVAALDEFSGRTSETGGSHLDEVVERYGRASEAFSAALEAAVASGDEASATEGRALLARRVAHEQEIMCGWSPVGR